MATGNAFQYDVYQGDKSRNEKRYQEIAQVILFGAVRVCVSVLRHSYSYILCNYNSTVVKLIPVSWHSTRR